MTQDTTPAELRAGAGGRRRRPHRRWRACRARRYGPGGSAPSPTRSTRPPTSWCRSRCASLRCPRRGCGARSPAAPVSCGCSPTSSKRGRCSRSSSTPRTRRRSRCRVRTCGGCSCRSGRCWCLPPATSRSRSACCGGDTASALAAGCPVIVKAHPGHPRAVRAYRRGHDRRRCGPPARRRVRSGWSRASTSASPR